MGNVGVVGKCSRDRGKGLGQFADAEVLEVLQGMGGGIRPNGA